MNSNDSDPGLSTVGVQIPGSQAVPIARPSPRRRRRGRSCRKSTTTKPPANLNLNHHPRTSRVPARGWAGPPARFVPACGAVSARADSDARACRHSAPNTSRPGMGPCPGSGMRRPDDRDWPRRGLTAPRRGPTIGAPPRSLNFLEASHQGHHTSTSQAE